MHAKCGSCFSSSFFYVFICGARLVYARVKGAGNANLRVGTGVRVARSWNIASDQGTKSEEGKKIDVGAKTCTETSEAYRSNS